MNKQELIEFADKPAMTADEAVEIVRDELKLLEDVR